MGKQLIVLVRAPKTSNHPDGVRLYAQQLSVSGWLREKGTKSMLTIQDSSGLLFSRSYVNTPCSEKRVKEILSEFYNDITFQHAESKSEN